MILLDYSGIVIAAIMANYYKSGQPMSEDLVRHIIINNIRSHNVRFKKDYGQMTLCCDSGGNWRREIFPEYKANRSKDKKEKDNIDWTMIYRVMDDTMADFNEYFPFDVVQVHRMEADDIIGVLSIHKNEDVLIVSGDHDFADQLLIRNNVSCYSPKAKKLINRDKISAEIARRTHILRGDPGDGVPNILSDDDTFIDPDKRQSTLRQTRVDKWLDMTEEDMINTFTKEQKKNYERNLSMVSFQDLDEDIVNTILVEYDKVVNERPMFSSNKLMTYFATKKMGIMSNSLNDFSPGHLVNAKAKTPLTSLLG